MHTHVSSFSMRLAIGFGALILGLSASVQASTVVIGGSGILTSADANQLAAWLGEGDLTLTNVFSHTTGDGKTASDFHSAADGLGPTFSIYETSTVNGSAMSVIVGGYNPHSWDVTANSIYEATALSDRTSFLFNLSADTMNPQRLDVDGGKYQGENFSYKGPSFGGGDDISSDSTLNSGIANAYSYQSQLIGLVPSTLTYSHLDVFTITATPEPATLSFMVAAGGFLLAKRLRRKCFGR